MTMMLPVVATRRMTANTVDQDNFCHHGRSNGRCWPVDKQSLKLARSTSRLVERVSISSRIDSNSLRFRLKYVMFWSNNAALQLYRSSRVTPFIVRFFIFVVAGLDFGLFSFSTCSYHLFNHYSYHLFIYLLLHSPQFLDSTT